MTHLCTEEKLRAYVPNLFCVLFCVGVQNLFCVGVQNLFCVGVQNLFCSASGVHVLCTGQKNINFATTSSKINFERKPAKSCTK